MAKPILAVCVALALPVLVAAAGPQGFHSGGGGMHSGGGTHAGFGHGAGTYRGPASGLHTGPMRGPIRGTARPGWASGRWRNEHSGWRSDRHDYFRHYPPYGFVSVVPILPFGDTGFYDEPAEPPMDDYAYEPEPEPPYADAEPEPEPDLPPSPYAPPLYRRQMQAAPQEDEQSTPQPPVTVVLRDGKSFQTQSYAVMNGTLWDFSKPNPRKVPVAAIDIAASQKATDAAGGEFPDLSSGAPSK